MGLIYNFPNYIQHIMYHLQKYSHLLFHCITAHKMTNKIPQTPEICVNGIFSA